MKRDWMCTGRRPSGLCGAAIIIAGRMHNFFRSKDEVVRVVKVGVQTLQKRLYEFRDSHAAFMTAEEIEKGGGEDGRVRWEPTRSKCLPATRPLKVSWCDFFPLRRRWRAFET